ncbi:hypothetical protein [Bradyrhizobium sp. AT1]|uniref:hypothetical protein n=1 Tax=Bradyrhizobium sp. AT1 TaxID=574934 RepID=UPI0007ABDFCB|nr:hypothetical protein [Bradyrhizobium sp. AT1]
MKLPNFDENSELNALRHAMRASPRDYTPPPPSDALTTEEIERLAGEGIDIPLDEVQLLNDGTHVYKGRRVIVYIRDVADYGGRLSMPKFHLAMCSTLSMMMEAGRFRTRYVVATREDGRFSIQRIRGETAIKSEEHLNVCQQCLDELNYRSFAMKMERTRRQALVQSFSIKDFFAEFGKSCVWANPKFDDISGPTNVYSPNFYRISKALKERRGYRCEQVRCKIDLSAPPNRRFLHAHHLNADKSDNHPTNIKLLCIRCHASEFQHSHLRDNPDYAIFCKKFP